MSVINQMLQDLERRKVNSEVSNHYIENVNIIAQKKIRPWFFILPILSLALLILYYYFYQIIDKSNEVIDLPLTEEKIAITQSNKSKLNYKEKNIIEDVHRAEIVNQSKEVLVLPFVDKSETAHHTAIQKINRDYRETAQNTIIKPEKTIKAEKIRESERNPALISSESVDGVEKEYVKVNRPAINNTEIVIYQARRLMQYDVVKSIALLEDRLSKVTPNVEYYALLANLYLRKQRFNEANSFYQKAIKKDSRDGTLWIGLALAYKGLGDIDNSRKAFKQAANSPNISPKLQYYAKQQSLQ